MGKPHRLSRAPELPTSSACSLCSFHVLYAKTAISPKLSPPPRVRTTTPSTSHARLPLNTMNMLSERFPAATTRSPDLNSFRFPLFTIEGKTLIGTFSSTSHLRSASTVRGDTSPCDWEGKQRVLCCMPWSFKSPIAFRRLSAAWRHCAE